MKIARLVSMALCVVPALLLLSACGRSGGGAISSSMSAVAPTSLPAPSKQSTNANVAASACTMCVTTDNGLTIYVRQTPWRRSANLGPLANCQSCIRVDLYLAFGFSGAGEQQVTDELPFGAVGFNNQWQLVDAPAGRVSSMYTGGAITGLCAGGEGSTINDPVFTIPLDAICFDTTLQTGACYVVPNVIPWFISEPDSAAPLTFRFTDNNAKMYDIALGTANGSESPPSFTGGSSGCPSPGQSATTTPPPTSTYQSPSPTAAPSAGYSLYSSPNANFPPLFYQFPVPRLGPSYGLVTLAFFISADSFTPPGPPVTGVVMNGLGDGRGFASNGLPDPAKARVIFSLDFSTGQGLMRVNTSCVQVTHVAGGADATACGGPNIIVPWRRPIPFGDASTLGVNDVLAEMTSHGLLLELAASNGAAFPYGSWLAGEIDAQIAFQAEPKIAAELKGFPSTEAYQIVNGQLGHTLIQVREQNWNSADAKDQSPDLSALKSPPPSTSMVYCTDPKFC